MVYKDYYGFNNCILFSGSVAYNHGIKWMEFPDIIIVLMAASSAANKSPVVKSYAYRILSGASFKIGLPGPVVCNEIIFPAINADA